MSALIDPTAQGEMGAEGIYPHISEDRGLGSKDVESVVVLEDTKIGEGKWKEALDDLEKGWLVY